MAHSFYFNPAGETTRRACFQPESLLRAHSSFFALLEPVAPGKATRRRLEAGKAGEGEEEQLVPRFL